MLHCTDYDWPVAVWATVQVAQFSDSASFRQAFGVFSFRREHRAEHAVASFILELLQALQTTMHVLVLFPMSSLPAFGRQKPEDIPPLLLRPLGCGGVLGHFRCRRWPESVELEEFLPSQHTPSLLSEAPHVGRNS